MSQPVVIGLGELLWDVFPDSRRPGGAPANVAYHAAQLGLHGVVASRVGDDADGRELREFLRGKRLDDSLLQIDGQHPTGRVTVELTADGQPSYVIHEGVAWEHLDATPAWTEAASRAAAICFGTLAQRTADSREAIHRMLDARGSETLIVYDVNLRQNWYAREWIERSLQATRIVKLNEQELRVLADLLETGDHDPERFAASLRERFDVAVTIVTRAEHGCLVFDAVGSASIPGEPVQVVDAVGAGDAFTAAFIAATLAGHGIEPAARFANRIGGLVASRAGAMPPIAEEAQSLWRQHFAAS